jgi:hypothetical protein
MKKFLYAGLLALATVPALAQTAPRTDVVVVRIAHGGGRGLVTTSFGPNNTQVKELTIPFSSGNKAAVALTEATQQALAPLVQQGYTVQSMSGGEVTTLIVLTKPK